MIPRQIFALLRPSACTPSRSSSYSLITKRFSRAKAEPFILPRLAIDLDAPDNPAVQEYNEAIHNRIPEHALQTQKLTLRALRRRKELQKNPVKVRRWAEPETTSLDLITYALFGKGCLLSLKETNMPREAKVRLRRVLKQQAVDYEDTADITVRKLTEHFEWEEPAKFIGLGQLEKRENLKRMQVRSL
jgi:hypothetical protein